MMILALEFSSEQRSVACSRHGTVLAEAKETGGRATNAMGMIEKTLKQAEVSMEEIEGIVTGVGPGSYTGIRTAVAVAQGWHLVRPVKFLGISSMHCLAAQAQAAGLFGAVHIVVDAQRGDVYHSLWSVSETKLGESSPLAIFPVSQIPLWIGNGETLAGPEALRWHVAAKTTFPSASVLCQLAAKNDGPFTTVVPEPVYWREVSFVRAPPSRAY
jgi:tRNA threonylcarbamoyladenosine biosynthesis protein TsaB